MVDPHRPEDVAHYNDRSLKTLVRAIALSQGQFSLILARCNYGGVQREILGQLQIQSSAEIRELVLSESTKTLYKAIQEQITAEQLPKQPEGFALMVSGLEAVGNLDELLAATNQVRDEFRKSFQFPLVLWVNDDVLQKLARLAPDFNSWAGVPIQFAIATETLLHVLRQKADELFDNVFDAGSCRFVPNSAIFGLRYRLELESALRDLRSRGTGLESGLEACKQFVLGRDEYASDRIEQALEFYQQSLTFWQETNSLERQGVVLFHIGLCYYRNADLQRLESRYYLEKARDTLRQCLDVFEQAERQDWVAKFISQLGEVLRRLEAWDELRTVAQKSLIFHHLNGNEVQLAKDYGFLAEVALKSHGIPSPYRFAKKANKLAEKALCTLAKAPNPCPPRTLYLLLLAQSQQYLNQPQEAVQNLEKAREEGNHQYDPQLYIHILEALRSLYFKQGQYRAAFQIKREQRSIEQQYGFRAFIGAARLQPQRHSINPALVPMEQQATVAQEIAASDRQRDVERLIKRVARPDQKLTVIYGQSGVGKSSIITAGLVPALKQRSIEARDALPIVMRVYSNWVKELSRGLEKAFEKRGCRLSETLDSAASILEQLKKNEDRNLITVLIFDQFEEFFFHENYGETAKRQPFYNFLRDCLNIPFVKVFFSIREDHLFCLLEFNRLTDLQPINNNILDKDILYYLGNFSREEAGIVIQSLTKRSQFYLEPELIDELVRDLASELGEVRPIELQIIGDQLQTDRITTLEKYHQLGPKAKLVERFLEEVVIDCGPENERAARLILYLLTDENKTRPLKTRAELAAGLVAEYVQLEPEKLDFVLEILVRSGLLLLWPFPTDCYQLVHDYLVPFIQQKKGAEFGKKLKKANEERQRIEEQLSRVRKWRRRAVVLAVTTSLLAASAVAFASIAGFQRQRAEIAEANSKAEALILSNDQLGALIASVKAGKKLQQIKAPLNVLLVRTDIKNQTVDRLQQTLSRVQERNRLERHGGSVLGVSFSPDGQAIASAGDDNRVNLWKPDGTFIRSLTGHSKAVTKVSFSPNGQTIASASEDKTVRLWSRDGQELKTLSGHQAAVRSVSFSPDNQMIASASDDNTIKLWNPDGRELKTLKGHEAAVRGVSFSSDNQTIASASADKTIKLWNKNGTLLQTLTGHSNSVLGVSFSPDGQTIASASADNTIKLWNKDGTFLKTLTGHSKAVTNVSFSPDSQMIASASADNTVKIWSRDGTLLKTLLGHRNFVWSVSFSPDGQMIASASADNTVKLWRSDSTFRSILTGHSGPVSNVSFSPDDQLIASASADKTVKLWKRDGTLIHTLTGHEDQVWGVSFSPDDQAIASASADKTVKLWKPDGTLLHTFKGHKDKVFSVSFSPEGQTIASASADNTIKLWNKDGTLLKTLMDHKAAVNWVSFSPDGQRMASASDDNTVKLWTRDGIVVKTLIGHSGHVNWVSFSPDSQTIASASDDNTVKLWNRDGEEIKTLKDHTGKVWSVSFSPDGQTIASASDDNTVKLWNRDGSLIYTLKGYSGPVVSVTFSPDNKTLASVSDDNTVILRNWDIDLKNWDKELMERGCDWLRNYLQTNPNVSKSDRTLCNDIPTQK